MVDLSPQYDELKAETDAAVLRVLSGGRFILGDEVSAFEEEFSRYLGVARGVGVASGTDALVLTMMALGVGPGDEVLTTPSTFIATADAIARCGAIPVFADIDPATFNLDPSSVEERLTKRTRAIIVVHLYGGPAPVARILELAGSRGIPVIEDCAQAHGAAIGERRVGSLGTAATFSFFPTKPLGCAGDGGMVCTDDEDLAEKVRMLRAHGARRKYVHEEIGLNSRLDELQAAILRLKLGRLDKWNEARRRAARRYDDRLEGVTTPRVMEGAVHAYHLYTVRSPERDLLKARLDESGIASAVYYPVPVHLQPCFRHLGYRAGDFPESERAAAECLSLPMYYGIPSGHVERVCDTLNEALG